MKYCSCPKCGKEFELTPDYDGASFRCDWCNGIIFVPENFSKFPDPKEKKEKSSNEKPVRAPELPKKKIDPQPEPQKKEVASEPQTKEIAPELEKKEVSPQPGIDEIAPSPQIPEFDPEPENEEFDPEPRRKEFDFQPQKKKFDPRAERKQKTSRDTFSNVRNPSLKRNYHYPVFNSVPEKKKTSYAIEMSAIALCVFPPLGVFALILALLGRMLANDGEEKRAGGFYIVAMFFSVLSYIIFPFVIFSFGIASVLR